MTFDEAATKYVKQFGENLPIYFLNGYSQAEIMAMIERALADNKPIAVEYDPAVDY